MSYKYPACLPFDSSYSKYPRRCLACNEVLLNDELVFYFREGFRYYHASIKKLSCSKPEWREKGSTYAHRRNLAIQHNSKKDLEDFNLETEQVLPKEETDKDVKEPVHRVVCPANLPADLFKKKS